MNKYYRFYDKNGVVVEMRAFSPEEIEALDSFNGWVGTAPSLHDPRNGYVCKTN